MKFCFDQLVLRNRHNDRLNHKSYFKRCKLAIFSLKYYFISQEGQNTLLPKNGQNTDLKAAIN